jgi:hypothetical protein
MVFSDFEKISGGADMAVQGGADTVTASGLDRQDDYVPEPNDAKSRLLKNAMSSLLACWSSRLAIRVTIFRFVGAGCHVTVAGGIQG